MKEVYKANTITGMLTSLHWVLDIELSFQSDRALSYKLSGCIEKFTFGLIN